MHQGIFVEGRNGDDVLVVWPSARLKELAGRKEYTFEYFAEAIQSMLNRGTATSARGAKSICYECLSRAEQVDAKKMCTADRERCSFACKTLASIRENESLGPDGTGCLSELECRELLLVLWRAEVFTPDDPEVLFFIAKLGHRLYRILQRSGDEYEAGANLQMRDSCLERAAGMGYIPAKKAIALHLLLSDDELDREDGERDLLALAKTKDRSAAELLAKAYWLRGEQERARTILCPSGVSQWKANMRMKPLLNLPSPVSEPDMERYFSHIIG